MTMQRSLVRAWADKYVDTTNAGKYDELGAQFARDAVFLPPNGATLRGPDEIGDFYRNPRTGHALGVTLDGE
jgi:ketosteroid isomerase-like protein